MIPSLSPVFALLLSLFGANACSATQHYSEDRSARQQTKGEQKRLLPRSICKRFSIPQCAQMLGDQACIGRKQAVTLHATSARNEQPLITN
jgi:hypothetical protein